MNIDRQLDLLLTAVSEHSLPAWPHERLVAGLDLMNTVGERALAQAALRLVSREVRALVTVRDLHLAAMGGAIIETKARQAGAGSAP